MGGNAFSDSLLGSDLFAATDAVTLKYNDKAGFKAICRKLDIPVVEGECFTFHSEESANYPEMASMVNRYLTSHKTVIIRGTLGESGTSLYKTAGTNLQDLYREIADSGEQQVLIEPCLELTSTPNDPLIAKSYRGQAIFPWCSWQITRNRSSNSMFFWKFFT